MLYLATQGKRYRTPRSPAQNGNALISALLALIVSALGAVGYHQAKQLELKLQMAQAQATVLEKLRDAVNQAIFDNATTILSGNPISKVVGGVPVASVVPQTLGGELVWHPSIIELRDMGYLPPGWNLTRSSLNDQGYGVQFRRSVPCAAPPNCDIEGTVTIMGAITSPGSAQSDGTLIGPILTRLGVDSAVSLPSNPATLTGWDHTWTAANPVPGQPAGVVAVRVGTAASSWATFVRIGDLRDPALAGNLSVQGNLAIQGTSRLNGDLTALGAIDISNGSTVCSRLDNSGIITLGCTGRLNAVTGLFSQGLSAGNLDVGAATEPDTIRVASGDLFVRGTGGFVRVSADGDMQTSGGLTSGDTVIAPNLRLNQPVSEGASCTPTTLATLVGGGVAFCTPAGIYQALMRYGVHRTACSTEGAIASDQNTGESLLCRSGQWMLTSSLLSGQVLMASWVALDGTEIPMPACRNTGPTAPETKLFLHAGNEATPDGTILRTALVSPAYARGLNASSGYFEGGAWVVRLTNSSNAPLASSSVLATTYCLYQ